MQTIELETTIKAPIAVVFDLARSVDVHLKTAAHTAEEAVAGRLSGLLGINETVTWRARHLGLRWQLTVAITRLERPHRFDDEMVSGPFAVMKHRHTFEPWGEATLMKDHFTFSAPGGIFGLLAEVLLLRPYLERFLRQRNAALKQLAEGGEG